MINSTMMHRFPIFATLILLLAIFTTAVSADSFVPVSQDRTVYGNAFVENYYIGEQDSDSANDAAVDFGLFDSAQSATAELDYGYASGGGWQVSTIGGSRIDAQGSQYANAESYDWDTYADASGRSIFDVTFDVPVMLETRLSGTVEAYDSGYCSVVLTGPSGIVFSEYGDSYYGLVAFDESITLEAGTWRLEARATGSVYSEAYYYGYSFAQFDVALDASPLAAGLSCIPGSGTIPYLSRFTVNIDNLEVTRPSSLVAARIDITLAGGPSYSNWKGGSTTIPSGSSFNTSWNQNIPRMGDVVGENVFTFVVEDVTPAPYNQPPYSSSGFITSDSCTVVGIADAD